MFDEIPLNRPKTPLLDQVNKPDDLRCLQESDLEQLAYELRHFLIYTVGQTGGHFGAGLGVVELTIALHYAFNTPEDRIVWDVGHQTYPHKILTGRREQMHMLRQPDGIAPFPSRTESEFDTFGVGHSSTSISAALGMSIAAAMKGDQRRFVAVIGDGAMSGGLAFEALNHAAEVEANLLVVLNDNGMSISRNVGGLAKYFAKILASRPYLSMREGSKKVLSHVPIAWELARRTEEHMKGMVVPGTLFEEMGFNYIGPIDGHNVSSMVHIFNNIKDQKGPLFAHLVTTKGKGYEQAEKAPVSGHSLAKIEAPAQSNSATSDESRPSYSQIFGDWLCDMAEQDRRLIGITPAMKEGSGLVQFAERYSDRYYDVAIAEQHALTLAAGLACEGAKPVVAIYSTFLQRAYDQLIHDVAIQDLDILFAIDRAGLLEDGPTHSGCFDLSYLRCIPNMIIMAPSDENETRQMLFTGYQHHGPAAVRYPRGTGPGVLTQQSMQTIPIGKGLLKREGTQVAILSFGSMLSTALQVGDQINATVADMRFVKPLDEDLIRKLSASHELLVTVEENMIQGGAGSAVNELLASAVIPTPILNLGVPDRFVEHDKPARMLASCGLDVHGVRTSINDRLSHHGSHIASVKL
jgi:1-deoxy-D-xylulose-5-phosphate synthase